MSNSKAEQRKCGPWLHGWLGVLFTQCVLYGITLVKVLSTRTVSISSTLSLILQPNPSMSENMCGLAIRLELDGISHQCVTEPQRILCSLDSWDVTYRVRFAFNMPAVFDFLNGVSLRHEIEVSCGHVLLPLENSLISHSSNDHSYPKQFEKTMRGVWLLRAVHGTSYDPCVVSQCVCSSSTLQWLNLIKNVLTTLQYSLRFLHIDTITPLLWASMQCHPTSHQYHVVSILMTIFLGDCCRVTLRRQGSGNNRHRKAAVWDQITWSPSHSLSVEKN